MQASSFNGFKVPANQTVVEQYWKSNGVDKEVRAIITRHNATGLFSIYLKTSDGFEKKASGKTPEFREIVPTIYG